MTQNPAPPSDDAIAAVSTKPVASAASPTKTARLPRYFYFIISVMLFVFMFWGFQLFYTRGQAYPGRPIAPPAKAVIVAHGIAMTLWMVLYMVQPWLIARRSHKLHMKVGMFGAGLAALIVVLGIFTAIQAAKAAPPEAMIWGLDYPHFLAIPFFAILAFGGFVSVAVWKKRKPAIHRASMLMATLCALTAALNRIDVFNNWYIGTTLDTIFGPFLIAVLIGGIVLLSKLAFTRKLDRDYVIAYIAMIAILTFTWQIAPTDAWLTVSNILTH